MEPFIRASSPAEPAVCRFSVVLTDVLIDVLIVVMISWDDDGSYCGFFVQILCAPTDHNFYLPNSFSQKWLDAPQIISSLCHGDNDDAYNYKHE